MSYQKRPILYQKRRILYQMGPILCQKRPTNTPDLQCATSQATLLNLAPGIHERYQFNPGNVVKWSRMSGIYDVLHILAMW